MELHQDSSGQRETVQVCSHSRECPKPVIKDYCSGNVDLVLVFIFCLALEISRKKKKDNNNNNNKLLELNFSRPYPLFP